MHDREWLYAFIVFTIVLGMTAWRVGEDMRVKLGRDTASHMGYNRP
jgi:hypothetical protein